MKSKLLLLLLLLALVAGCTGNVKPNGPVVVAQAMVVCDDTPTGVDRLQMEAVEFHAVRGQKISGGPTTNWIALTPEGYEALGRNIQRILIQTKQSAAVIRYYRSCIDTANKTVTGPQGTASDSAKAAAQEATKPKDKAVKPETKPSDDPPEDLEDEDSKKFWQFWRKNA